MSGISGLVPSISLGANGGSQGTGQGSSPMGGSLALLGPLLQMREFQNQNQQFQTQMAARQRIGQIISQAPDLATGYNQAAQDPAAAYVPDVVNSLRQGQLAQIQAQGLAQKQQSDALDNYYKQVLGRVAADPTQDVGKLTSIALAALPPELRAKMAPVYDSANKSFFDGLDPRDPNLAVKVQLRGEGAGISAGLPAGYATSFMPKTVQIPQGNQIGIGAEQPGGMGITPVAGPGGAPIPLGLGPQVAAGQGPQGEQETKVVGGGATGGLRGGAPSNGVPAGTGQGGGPAAPGGAPSPSNAAPSATLFPGQSTSAKTSAESQAKATTDMEGEMAQSASEIPNQLQRLNVLQNALGQFKSGGGTMTTGAAAQLLQGLQRVGFPVTDGMITKVQGGKGNLAAQQVFTSELTGAIAANLKASAEGMRVFAPELGAQMQAISVSNDPAALSQLLGNMRQRYMNKLDQAGGYVDFKQKLASGDPSVAGYTPNLYPVWYAKQKVAQDQAAGAGQGAGAGAAQAPPSAAAQIPDYIRDPKNPKNIIPNPAKQGGP